MGCPKSFSISGGMGAALLTKPELIHDVCNAYPLKCFFFFFPFPQLSMKNFCLLYLAPHLAPFKTRF